MNMVSLVFRGTAKAKRARRGCERDWNRFGDPCRKFMKHGDSMPTSPRFLDYRRKRDRDVRDDQ